MVAGKQTLKQDAARIVSLAKELLYNDPVAVYEIFTPTCCEDIWDKFFSSQLESYTR